MVMDCRIPVGLFSCLLVGDKSHDRLRGKTLGGRIGKKGKRPIPKAFLERFLEEYAQVAHPHGGRVKKAVVEYYTKAFTKGDYDFDPSEEKYPEIFEQQLEAVKDKDLDSPENRGVISHDKQWRVIDKLGNGTFGEIYLLKWYPFGTEGPINFALKETCNDVFWVDYCNEGELTRRLNVIGCPNVVKVHDWIKSGDPTNINSKNRWESCHRFRILYDYYEDGDLDELISYYRQNRLIFPESFVWHVIHQVATALLYCANGQPAKKKKSGWEEIMHMDVKPKNRPRPRLLEEVYPKLLLSDFGLAQTIPNEEVRAYKKAFPRGTPDFQAPESREDANNSHSISIATDIYSLGVALSKIVDKSEDLIYTKQELDVVRRQPDIDPYLPFTSLLRHTKAQCMQDAPSQRPKILSLWELSRKQAMEWAAPVRQGKLAAFEKGELFYYGKVVFDKSLRERLLENEELHEEFQRATKWEFNNRDRVQEIRDELRREEAGLLPLRKINGFNGFKRILRK